MCVLIGCGRSNTSSCPAALKLTPALCSKMMQTILPETLVAGRGNRFADNYDAARFGHGIFFDARFSKNVSMRCADCHVPERAFQDGTPTPVVAPGIKRNTPTVINSAWLKWQFWDGRADSLWSQALAPLESSNEMNFSRLEVVHLIDRGYRPSYERVFGPLLDFSDVTRFPPRGAPGDAAYDRMLDADKQAVNVVFVNVGKAIEAYERKLAAGRSRVDRFMLGDHEALTKLEQHGLSVFARASCLDCHNGPMFTDELFHNIGVPAQLGAPPDQGRTAGLESLVSSQFTLSGPFADPAESPNGLANHSEGRDLGAIRTASLRNVSLSPPYGHNGAFATLEDVVDFHLRGGGRSLGGFIGDMDGLLQPQNVSRDDRDALVAFLRALNGEYPSAPWRGWPDR